MKKYASRFFIGYAQPTFYNPEDHDAFIKASYYKLEFHEKVCILPIILITSIRFFNTSKIGEVIMRKTLLSPKTITIKKLKAQQYHSEARQDSDTRLKQR